MLIQDANHKNRPSTILVKVAEFAAMVSCGRTKAWQMIRAGEVQVVRHSGTTRVRLDSIVAFIEGHTVAGDK
jgi:hypothetical protein